MWLEDLTENDFVAVGLLSALITVLSGIQGIAPLLRLHYMLFHTLCVITLLWRIKP